jgi:hypothetical protein
MKIKVFWVNHGWFSAEEFDTLAAALAYARSKGSTASFHQEGTVLGAWDILGGYKSFCPRADGGYMARVN